MELLVLVLPKSKEPEACEYPDEADDEVAVEDCRLTVLAWSTV